MSTIILGIESSCDDTSAAVIKDGYLLSNVVSSQAVHEAYGGVVPELASRAHQQNIVPVVHEALKRAGVTKEELSAVAFTRGPGLMGSLLVGVSFAKGFARSLNIPMIDVNHLTGHVLAHFIKEEGEANEQPDFPFLCLLVSGGNSQIILVKAYNDMEILGQTIDDAAGEAIDKCSKVMGLGYPGGPIIDKLARQGNPKAFTFSKPHIPGLDYSFSGLKTSFLYSKSITIFVYVFSTGFIYYITLSNPTEKIISSVCVNIGKWFEDYKCPKYVLRNTQGNLPMNFP